MKSKWCMVALFLAVAICARCAKAGDQPLAKIGDQVITETDLLGDLQKFGMLEPGQALPVLAPEQKKDLVEKMVLYRVLGLAVADAGTKLDPTIEKRLAMQRQGMLFDQLIGDYLKANPVKDEDIKALYDQQKDRFVTPSERKLRHILVKTQAEAKKAQQELKAGKKFEDLAKKSSIDPGSKDKGGDLGWVQRGRMVKEFDDAAFALTKKGSVSGIVKTQFGYHLIKLDDMRDAKPMTIEEAKPEIQKMLEGERVQGYFENLKTKYRVQIMEIVSPAPAAAPAESKTK